MVLLAVTVLTELSGVTSGMTMTVPYGIAGTCGTASTSGSGTTSGSCPGGILTPDTAEVQISQYAAAGSSSGSTGNATWATWGNAQTTPWFNWIGHASYAMDLNYSLNLAAGDVYAKVACGGGTAAASGRAVLGYLFNIWDITGSAWVWTSDITGVLYDTGHISCSGSGGTTVSNSAISNSGQTPNYIISASTPLLTLNHWYRVKIQVDCYTAVQTNSVSFTTANSDCNIQNSDTATLENAGVWP